MSGQVSIPRTVEIGQENIILNCDYHFDDEEARQLEIKWYFNKDPSPFFQWIAGLPDSKGGLHEIWDIPQAKMYLDIVYTLLKLKKQRNIAIIR